MQRPSVGVGVIVRKEGKVLCIERNNSIGSETWGLPGGHLEPGESFIECAQRELLEECGIQLSNVQIAHTTNDIFEKEDMHYVTIFVVGDLTEGAPEILEPDKITKLEWYSWDEIPTPRFLPLENLIKSGYRPFDKISL